MRSNTLDELGRAVLEAIARRQRVTIEALDSEFDAPRADLEDRLSRLVDNALVRDADDGEYELTENGVRVLNATPTGSLDNRIDTPDRVETAIEAFELPPDEAAAVRSAFSFLRYWGDATTAEIIDATYSEAPAGYETADRWWEDCVEDRLAALPGVRLSPHESIAERWEYEGDAVVETPDDEDGREVFDPTSAPSSFGSVRRRFETLELREDERLAARVAFAILRELGTATAAELADRAYGDHPAGYDSTDAWADWLSETFAEIPTLDRETGTDGKAVWAYRPPFENEEPPE